MAYNYRHYKRAKAERLAAAWDKVDQLVFARLGVTTDVLHHIDQQLLGQIILKGMEDYPRFQTGKGMSPFDKGEPLIIFRCEDVSDVWLALKACREFDWPFTCRSGGHSTAGYSSDCQSIIDMSGLTDIHLAGDGRVSVGPGCNFGKFNRFMMLHKLHVPTGNCDDVCCGGYVQGGGYGYTSRQFGMQLDTVVEMTVILADGRTVKASKTQNPDLYWAMRGGTGNNFGILVNIVYQAVQWDIMWGFVITWDGDKAAQAMYTAQNTFGPDNGLEIGYTGNITTIATADGSRKPVYMFSGICIHGRDKGMEAIRPMLEIGGEDWMYDQTDYYYFLNDEIESKLPGPPLTVEGMYEIKSSAYLERPMTLEEWQKFFAFYEGNIARTNPYNLIVLEAYGGAINEVPVNDTAFIHRDTRMDIYIDAFWAAQDSELHGYDAAQKWMNDINAFLQPLTNGHYYQNYPQRDMPNFRWQYWGDAYNTLQFVKNKYDPDNVFHYEQSITPYPSGEGIDHSVAPSLFSAPGIDYGDQTDAFDKGPGLVDGSARDYRI